jgi:DNA-binding PadR family transcriptional regulator
LGKDEADIVRRLRVMQKSGLLRSDWGNRLGKNVKLYSLTANAIDIDIQREGMRIQYKKRSTSRKTGTKVHLTREPADSTVSRESDKKPEQYIVGRKEELEILHNEKINFIFIVGVAGMGKTSLARKFVTEISLGCRVYPILIRMPCPKIIIRPILVTCFFGILSRK